MRRSDRKIENKDEILAILREARVCRIALHDDPYPYIVPLNFGVEEGEPLKLYFHSALEGRKIDLIKRNSKVAFEVDFQNKLISGDKACDWTMHYKCIMGTGIIKLVNEPEVKIHGLNVLMKHFSGRESHEYTEKLLPLTQVLCLEVCEISAKQHGH